MTVYVVSTEWNHGSDSDGASTIEGAYDNPVAARRAAWAAMREYSSSGYAVYGRKNDCEWDCDVTVSDMEIESAPKSRVPAVPPCETHAYMRWKRCYCRHKPA